MAERIPLNEDQRKAKLKNAAQFSANKDAALMGVSAAVGIPLGLGALYGGVMESPDALADKMMTETAPGTAKHVENIADFFGLDSAADIGDQAGATVEGWADSIRNMGASAPIWLGLGALAMGAAFMNRRKSRQDNIEAMLKA